MWIMLAVYGFLIVFAIFFVSRLKSAGKKNTDSTANTVNPNQADASSHRYDGEFDSSRELTPSQRAYLDGLKRKQQAAKTASASKNTHADDCPAVADAHRHKHIGFEEHYEPIEGSLGSVNDEGCADLNGVRLIDNDPDYAPFVDGNDDGRKAVLRAMILGEMLDNPAWKKPYNRK